MPLIKENLSEEDKKKLATFLHIENVKEAFEKLSINDINARFSAEIKCLETIEDTAEVNKLKALKDKLSDVDDADWQASLGNTVNYSVIKEPNSTNETLFQLNGSLLQQKETYGILKTTYKEITGKEPEEVKYENKDQLPEKFTHLKEKVSPQTPFIVATFVFHDGELDYFNRFNQLIVELERIGKISLTPLPQITNISQETPERISFRL